MTIINKIEVPIDGMDCADCTMHVQKAISGIPGVQTVQVYLTTEKAVVELDPDRVDITTIRSAVEKAGYAVPDPQLTDTVDELPEAGQFTRSVLTFLGIVFGAVLFVIVVGEWLGLFQAITTRVPWYVGFVIVLAGGFPVFRKVIRAAIQGQVISHTLMTLGVIAALVVGEWATAAVVVFFMRIGDYVESFTAERARRAVKDLRAMAPQIARIWVEGQETDVPIQRVEVGDIIVVRPGEMIPVDGEVIFGRAVVDQASITGEAMPVEIGPGFYVYAATILGGGGIRIRTEQVGVDTTFGRVITMVEEAEAHRADVQRVADKFSTYYLPIVAGLAAMTYLISRNPMSTAAVLVVACSCAFALATPIAMLASIGAGARRGLMIKGGKYLELLDRADTLLIDKTGTVTLGKPAIAELRILESHAAVQWQNDQILTLAASAERYSEHPLAEAVRMKAIELGLALHEPQEFESIPGFGVRAQVDGKLVSVGNRRMFATHLADNNNIDKIASELEGQGKSILVVAVDGAPVALLAAADQLRPEVPAAIQMLSQLGISHIELLTGDHPGSAKELLAELSDQMDSQVKVGFRADLLPQDKIEIVKSYQSKGKCVVMIGDGVNDAPALAQADVGIAMGVAGSDVAIEAAHIALMRDDWTLIPEVFQIAKRTMRVVKGNIAFTAIYNLLGLSLAAMGLLPPIFAAAAQSLPDIGILANSSRLLRQK